MRYQLRYSPAFVLNNASIAVQSQALRTEFGVRRKITAPFRTRKIFAPRLTQLPKLEYSTYVLNRFPRDDVPLHFTEENEYHEWFRNSEP
jgi:hypothetical protein